MESNLTSGGVLRMAMTLVVVLALVGGGVAYFMGLFGHKGEEQDEFQEAVISVKTVNPRYGKSDKITQKRPANVRPYYSANLETRVPGIVNWIPFDVGHQFLKGDKLIEVFVPDLVARERERVADQQQAEAQVKQKKAEVKTAEAILTAAKEKVKAAQARLDSSIAYQEFRKKQAERYKGLLAEGAIDARLVDEQIDRFEASKQIVIADGASLAYAVSEVKAADAKVEQAKADVEAELAKVEVAKASLNYARAMLDYATIKAPFDGEISRRNVDPGFFVQNAGDGHAEPLLVVQRNDIVTVVVRVPDTFASYITPNTETIFETAALPGVKIHGKVTRYPQSLVNVENDRTMLVEVDLWNRDAKEFAAKFKDKKKEEEFRDGLKRPMPGDTSGGLPVVPKLEGELVGGRQMRLLPGMFGQMTVILRKFTDVHLLPSSAIVTLGGYNYIYVVAEGKAHLQPVKVQVDDGKFAKIELLTDEGESLGDLTGKEVVIVTNQGELSEGSLVKPTMVEDWKSLPGLSDVDKHEKKK